MITALRAGQFIPRVRGLGAVKIAHVRLVRFEPGRMVGAAGLEPATLCLSDRRQWLLRRQGASQATLNKPQLRGKPMPYGGFKGSERGWVRPFHGTCPPVFSRPAAHGESSLQHISAAPHGDGPLPIWTEGSEAVMHRSKRAKFLTPTEELVIRAEATISQRRRDLVELWHQIGNFARVREKSRGTTQRLHDLVRERQEIQANMLRLQHLKVKLAWRWPG